jgi:methylmalonyl-CoA/ethylmalonyl-CoA epimerase
MHADLQFHHHGLALRDDAMAVSFLEAVGYSSGERIYDPLQDVELRLCTHDTAPAVEFVMPGRNKGPLTEMLARYDQLIYHTCYEVEDRSNAVERLQDLGLRVVDVLRPTPAILFGGRLVSFHIVIGYGVIELLDRR